MAGRDRAVVVEEDGIRDPFENQERFSLGRIQMAMRPDISTTQQNIQKPVRIFKRVPMEIMIHAKARTRLSERLHRVEERTGDQLGIVHRSVVHRSRANPLPAAIATVVTVVVAFVLPALFTAWLLGAEFPFLATIPLVASLIGALVQAIGLSYVALIITKTYTDAAFTRRW